jgi:hypothetical protein
MTALYELTNQYRTLVDLAFEEVDEDGQLTGDFLAVLSNLEDGIDNKLSALCRVVRELDAVEQSAKQEAAFFRDKANRAALAVERLKSYMKTNLEELGETKRKVDDVFTVAIQNNPPSVDVYDLDKIPHEFDVPQVRIVDKTRIKELLKTGQEIPGAVLMRGTHLRIR